MVGLDRLLHFDHRLADLLFKVFPDQSGEILGPGGADDFTIVAGVKGGRLLGAVIWMYRGIWLSIHFVIGIALLTRSKNNSFHGRWNSLISLLREKF